MCCEETIADRCLHPWLTANLEMVISIPVTLSILSHAAPHKSFRQQPLHEPHQHRALSKGAGLHRSCFFSLGTQVQGAAGCHPASHGKLPPKAAARLDSGQLQFQAQVEDKGPPAVPVPCDSGGWGFFFPKSEAASIRHFFPSEKCRSLQSYVVSSHDLNTKTKDTTRKKLGTEPSCEEDRKTCQVIATVSRPLQGKNLMRQTGLPVCTLEGHRRAAGSRVACQCSGQRARERVTHWGRHNRMPRTNMAHLSQSCQPWEASCLKRLISTSTSCCVVLVLGQGVGSQEGQHAHHARSPLL